MDDRIDTMIRRLFDRQPTADDIVRINKLIGGLPKEVLASPAMVADIVLRADELRRFEEAIQKASWEGQQRIHHDLQERIDRAANAALNKLRDMLPVDAHDAAARLLKMVLLWTVAVIVVASSGGWMLSRRLAREEQAAHHAIDEQFFTRCIDAAEGAAAASRSASGGVRYDAAVYREQARLCAAEFADRRAGG